MKNLKIALISFEYLPDTGLGGIATYVWNAARMLVRGGHHVEVACGSPTRSGTELEDGVVVHRIYTGSKPGQAFGALAAAVLESRHHAIGGFEVIELPEYHAEGAEFAQAHPDVALVVKLHTPSYLVRRLNQSRLGIFGLARFGLGALRRGRWPKLGAQPDVHHEDFERSVARAADVVAAPSLEIAQIVGADWELPKANISIFPSPFESPGEFTEISLPKAGSGKIFYSWESWSLAKAFNIWAVRLPSLNNDFLTQRCGA